MPQRSNLFQKVMTHIYSQMAPKGAHVTESAMIREQNTGQEREVDILVVQNVNGAEVLIGIEVRDRKAKDDVTWIDCIIGKYIDLPIDKKVAVSRSGFSQSARTKAEAHGIEAISLEQVLTTNWPTEFVKLGSASLTTNYTIKNIELQLDPPMNRRPLPTDRFTSEIDGNSGLLEKLIQDFLAENFDPTEHFRNHSWTLDNLNIPQKVVVEGSLEGMYILDDGGLKHAARNFLCRIECVFSHKPAAMRYQQFKNALVSQGTIIDEDKQPFAETAIVQYPNSSEVQYFVERSLPKKSK